MSSILPRPLTALCLVLAAWTLSACGPVADSSSRIVQKDDVSAIEYSPRESSNGLAMQDPGTQQIAQLFAARRSNVLVSATGTVERILADDLDPPRHQKFILRLSNKQTLLISHNIDLAPRINSLREGTNVTFSGEYEWSDKGGIVHWTHHDPNGRREGGWIHYEGYLYR